MALAIPTGSRSVRLVAVVVALALAVLSLRTGLGFALAGLQPALAVRIDGGNATALAALAEQTMVSAANDADVAAVDRLARDALRASPLESSALRNAGFILAVTGKEARARDVLEHAGKASLRDYLTHAWLLNENLRKNRVDDAVVEADIVLRQNVETWPVVLPALAGLLSDRRTLEPIAQRLATRPYWRPSFLQTLGAEGIDREAGYALLLRLRELGASAATTELQPYMTAIAARDARQAYRRWLALLPTRLPAGQDLIRDGGFSGLDAPMPFNWIFYPRDGVYAERATAADGAQVLSLSFDGTGQVAFVTQKLVLSPGSYRLSFRARSDGAIGPEQFEALMRCGDNGALLGTVTIPARADRWARFALDIAVPPSCADQHVWFMGKPSQTLDPASLWVDDVAIARR